MRRPTRSTPARPRRPQAFMRRHFFIVTVVPFPPVEKPASAARSRPRCRAVTTSVSAVIGIRRSSATVDASRPALDAELRLLVEEQQAFLEIQRGGHALEREAELDHGEGDLGLN